MEYVVFRCSVLSGQSQRGYAASPQVVNSSLIQTGSDAYKVMSPSYSVRFLGIQSLCGASFADMTIVHFRVQMTPIPSLSSVASAIHPSPTTLLGKP